MKKPTRRDALKHSAAAGAASLIPVLAPTAAQAEHHEKPTAKDFVFGLNTSTIRSCGGNPTIVEEIEAAGKAGYGSIEPWFRKINAHVDGGGKLSDLKKQLDDHGLAVTSAIGFAKWIVDDDAQRAKGMEEAKRDMDTIAQIGGTRIAAPPAGAPRDKPVDLDRAAERYHALLELGRTMGVTPQVEMWGGHTTIGTLSKAIYVAVKSGHPDACFLGDVYHMFKGGSDFSGLKLLGPNALQTFHMNDYPAEPPRAEMRDSDRVYPGDGIAPIKDILQAFLHVGATPVLNLELFNKAYWAKPIDEVARTGLAKMKAVVVQLS